MSDEAGAAISLLFGAILVRLSLTGAHRRYVKDAMGPWLLAAGILLIGLGVFALVRALRRRPVRAAAGGDHDQDHDPSGHAHGHRGEAVAWFLVVPVVTLLLVAPPALGAYSLDRTPSVNVRATGKRVFDPLPGGPTTVAMALLEFGQRAADGDGASFKDTPIQLSGFVAGDATSGGFRIARYQIACCAADAQAAVVEVVGLADPGLTPDQWVTVVGTFQPGGEPGRPRLLATTVTPIPPPDDPYDG